MFYQVMDKKQVPNSLRSLQPQHNSYSHQHHISQDSIFYPLRNNVLSWVDDTLDKGSTVIREAADAYERKNNPAYPLWEELRGKLEEAVGELTLANAVRGIEKGIGEESVLKLQEIARKELKQTSVKISFQLGRIMPDKVERAIMNYKPREQKD